jgi:heat shock protein HslJ
MTGMPRPVSVRVQLAKSTFKGCGGETAELLDGEWRVAKIGTLRVPTKLAVSIAFDVAARQVSGASGCNRYFGGFELTAESLSISRSLAGSMMACEEKATRIEEAFKASLPRVRRFDIAADGSLHLLSDGQSIVVARRVATTR